MEYPVMSKLSSKLDQKTLDMLKTLLEKFQWALKNGEVKQLKKDFKDVLGNCFRHYYFLIR